MTPDTRTSRKCRGDTGPIDSTQLHTQAFANNKAPFVCYFHGVAPPTHMECQEEKPIIYTMENKPIVTCEYLFLKGRAQASFSGLDS